jgi:hypothetical protein
MSLLVAGQNRDLFGSDCWFMLEGVADAGAANEATSVLLVQLKAVAGGGPNANVGASAIFEANTNDTKWRFVDLVITSTEESDASDVTEGMAIGDVGKFGSIVLGAGDELSADAEVGGDKTPLLNGEKGASLAGLLNVDSTKAEHDLRRGEVILVGVNLGYDVANTTLKGRDDLGL